MKGNTITTGGNIPLPGQQRPSTIILTQTRRFGIDIGSYINALTAAESIDFPQRTKLYDLYEDILMDPHLSSVINKRKSAILCSVIEFRRSGKPDEKINEQLRSPWFLHFLGDAFDAIPQGNTLVQFYRDKKTGWLNYIFIPRKHYDPVRKLILKRQHDITGIPWDEFDDLLFIGEPRSLGELAKAAPWVIYKRNSTADWAQFAEIFGMPMRKYTYDPEDESALEQLKENDAAQGAASSWFLPDGCNMDLVESGNKTGSSDLYKSLVDTCNSEISKLFLGNTLTTEAGTKGSQALGTVHGKVEERISQSDRKFILNLLNYEMTDIFLHLGIDTSGGEFCYSEPKMIDPTTKMNLFTQANALGLEISKKQMYDELGLECPENEKDTIKRLQASPFLPQIDDREEEDEEKRNVPSEGKSPAKKKGGLKNWWSGFFRKSPGGREPRGSFRVVINELYRDAAGNEASSVFSFDDEVMKQALKNIYSKSFHPMTDIEENLFNETWKTINEATDKGFGIRQPIDPDYDFYQELRHNNAVFSAFKVHRAQNDMAAQLLDSKGKLKPFEQWSKEVQPIATHQMEHWLRTEYDTAVIRAHQAADWRQFEREKDILPNLKWLPSTSIHPGADHKNFWGTILPIDHPFWKSHRPGDRWNCKCQLTSTDESSTLIDGISEGGDDDKPADGLKGNPGQTGELFDKSHPYVRYAYDGAKEAVDKLLNESIGSNVPSGLDVHEQQKWIENVHRTEEKLKLEQGQPMTFEEANGMKGNPHYKENEGYRENCQSCVVANELRRRGYNVEAQIRIKADSGNIPQQLSSKTEWAWIDPKTGEKPKKLTAGGQYWDSTLHREKAKSITEMKKEFDELTKEAGRYHLSFNWKGRSIEGHIITAERFDNGGLRIYDPQTGEIVDWKIFKTKIRTEYGIRLYRVDNMLINEDIINGIVREASQ